MLTPPCCEDCKAIDASYPLFVTGSSPFTPRITPSQFPRFGLGSQLSFGFAFVSLLPPRPRACRRARRRCARVAAYVSARPAAPDATSGRRRRGAAAPGSSGRGTQAQAQERHRSTRQADTHTQRAISGDRADGRRPREQRHMGTSSVRPETHRQAAAREAFVLTRRTAACDTDTCRSGSGSSRSSQLTIQIKVQLVVEFQRH